MGEKVELDDDLMIEGNQNGTDSGDSEVIQEVGDEAWVDDLINQQPDIPTYSSGEEEEGETGLADLILHMTELYTKQLIPKLRTMKHIWAELMGKYLLLIVHLYQMGVVLFGLPPANGLLLYQSQKQMGMLEDNE